MKEEFKLIKKILTIVSIASLAIGILIPILALFGVIEFKFGNSANFPSMLMLSMFVLCAASFFAINALNVINVNKTLSLVAIGLIVLSTIGALVTFALKLKVSETYAKILCVIAIATVLFVILIGTYLKLQKSYLALQIVLYVLVFALDVVLTAQIFGATLFDNETFLKVFVTVCLAVFVLLCATNILGKKVSKANNTSVNVEDSEYVKIKKSEYEDLLAKAKKLEELESKE